MEDLQEDTVMLICNDFRFIPKRSLLYNQNHRISSLIALKVKTFYMLKFCLRSARLLLIFAPLLVTACASPVQITQGGRNVQIISERNMHYMN